MGEREGSQSRHGPGRRKGPVGPSPGSIFPGRFVKLLRRDFRIAPELRGDYGLCWAWEMKHVVC